MFDACFFFGNALASVAMRFASIFMRKENERGEKKERRQIRRKKERKRTGLRSRMSYNPEEGASSASREI